MAMFSSQKHRADPMVAVDPSFSFTSMFSPIRRYIRRQPEPGIVASTSDSVESSQPERHSQPISDSFSSSGDLRIYSPPMFQPYTYSNSAMERLRPYTCPDAMLNSSARHPLPRCHEGTRGKVMQSLNNWFYDSERRSKAMWLYGSAGIGKSAVAQTFAEHCEAENCFGASFFFSRQAHRDEYETVIPTIAFQLATYIPSFRAALASVIVKDPTIYDKSPRLQLAQLIARPFSSLHTLNDPAIRGRFLIVLDGLDECWRLQSQLELVEMITEANQLTYLPFLWLICSRPEPHLTYTLYRVLDCNRHQLLIDVDTKRDVEKYLFDGFVAIESALSETVDEKWPPTELFRRIVDTVDGLFFLGEAILSYVGNRMYADPHKRLIDFSAFTEHPDRIPTNNPLIRLDLLYSQVLDGVPDSTMPMTRRILHYCAYITDGDDNPSAQVLANYLCMDQREFYDALRSLHSVLEIPSPEDAAEVSLLVYHTAFRDFLCNSARAGRFFISREEAQDEHSKSRSFWGQIILEGRAFDDDDSDFAYILPHLKWTQSSTPEHLASIVRYIRSQCRDVCESDRTSSGEVESPPTSDKSKIHGDLSKQANQETSGATQPVPADVLTLLCNVLRKESSRTALRSLRGESAQAVVEYLYSVLLEPVLPTLWLRKYCLVELYKLCKASLLYPHCYVLKRSIVIGDQQSSGGFSDIYKGHFGEIDVCLKVVRLYQKSDIDALLKIFAKEAILWGQLQHPNIVPFYGAYYFNQLRRQICLVSPWMHRGNLVDHLKQYPSMPRVPFVLDVVSGLDYLHNQDMIHGDLKGINVLVNDLERACITDFGLSRIRTDKTLPQYLTSSTTQGYTLRWAAPELLDGARASMASDVWALGCVSYEILTGVRPFPEMGEIQIVHALIKGENPTWPRPTSNSSPQEAIIWELVDRCCAKGPEARPKCQQILLDLQSVGLYREDNTQATDRAERERQHFWKAMRDGEDESVDFTMVEQILSELSDVN